MKTKSITFMLAIFVSFLASFASAADQSLKVGYGKDPYAWTPSTEGTQLNNSNFSIEGEISFDQLPSNGNFMSIVDAWHGSHIGANGPDGIFRDDRRRWSFAVKSENGKQYMVLALSGEAGTEFPKVEISITTGTPYSMKVTKVGSTVTFYLNEVSVGTASSSVTPRHSSGGINVGYFNTGFPDWSNIQGQTIGYIDDVRITSNGVVVANWTFDGSLVDSTGNHLPFEARGTSFGAGLVAGSGGTDTGGGNTGGGDNGGGGDTNPNPTIAELQAQVVALQGNLATAAAAKTAAEAQVTSLTATVAERDATIVSLQNGGGNAAVLQAQVAQLQSDKTSLQNQVVDLDAQLSSVTAERNSALIAKVSVENKVSTLERALESSNARTLKVVAERDSARAGQQQVETRVLTLENQFAVEKAARVAAEAAEGTAKVRVSQLEGQINSKDLIIKSKESIILSQKETIRILEQSTSQLVVNATATAAVQNLRISRVSKDEVEVSGDVNVSLWETGNWSDGYIIEKPAQTVSFRIPIDRTKDTYFRVMVDGKG